MRNHLRTQVGNTIKVKSVQIYSGCEWNPPISDSSIVAVEFEKIRPGLIDGAPKRWELREYLLTKAISKIEKESEIKGPARLRDGSRKKEDGSTETFRSDGPLVLMTGRLSPQKGVDLLLDAIPLVRSAIPESKFLLFLLT